MRGLLFITILIVSSYTRNWRLQVESRKVTKIIAVISTLALLLALNPLIFGMLTSTVQIQNAGTVKAVGVGVYWDSDCTNETGSISWGMLDPGSNKSYTVYIRNEGNTAESLSLNTEDWDPTNAQDYITLSWNYNGTILSPDQVIEVDLTLSVSSSIEGIENFSFTIVIIGTETS